MSILLSCSLSSSNSKSKGRSRYTNWEKSTKKVLMSVSREEKKRPLIHERITPSLKEFHVEREASLKVPFALIVLCLVLILYAFLKGKGLVLLTASFVLVTCIVNLYNKVTKETVKFIRSVGVQVQQFNALGTVYSTRFLPKSKIKTLIINEGIRRQRVIAYLALILHTPNSDGRTIVPLFKETLPRLFILRRMFQEAYDIVQSS